MSREITYEDIVKAWQCSSSPAEASQKLNGYKPSLLQYRVGRLRKLGVPLKLMPRSRRPAINAGHVEALKRLAKSLAGGAP